MVLSRGRMLAVPVLLPALLALSLAAGHEAQAQSLLSPPGVVRQRVGKVELTVTYNRPGMRGRRLFGGLVPWNEPWNPGADSASTIRFSGAVTMGGRAVPAGLYSIWIIPRDQGAWTVILSRAAPVFHAPYPGTDRDQLRLDVTPRENEHRETLEFTFPVVLPGSTILRFHWGTTVLDIPVNSPMSTEQ